MKARIFCLVAALVSSSITTGNCIDQICNYRGTNYACERMYNCLLDGGHPRGICSDGSSCCVRDFTNDLTNFGFSLLFRTLQRPYMSSDYSMYNQLPWLNYGSYQRPQIQPGGKDYGDKININENNKFAKKPIGSAAPTAAPFELPEVTQTDVKYQEITPTATDSSPTKEDDEDRQLFNENYERGDYKDSTNYRDCGQLRTRVKRIIGGRNSSFGSHPWQVAMYKPTLKGKPYCGGALLNDGWIVTAAHCVDDKKMTDLKIRLGEFDVKKDEEELLHKEYKAIRVVVHPQFSDKRHRNDVALVKLDRRVKFDQHIIPVCLPPTDLIVIGRRAMVTGWGRTRHSEKKSGPAVLNEVEIEVFPNFVCQKWFADAGHERNIDDIYLCAGQSKGGRDSCKGDSGGPLTTTVDGRQVLIGVVSWGFGCGREHSPGVYANIRKFVPWIESVIN